MQNFCLNCMKPLGNKRFCPYCGFDSQDRSPAAPYHLTPGTVLHQRYLIGACLGEGGFGITYIGLDQTLAKRVAVKEFYPSGAANRTSDRTADITVTQGKQAFFEKGVSRFLDEAKNVAAFSAEDGIVDVLDYFQENNTAYIVMEYLEGETLKASVAHQGVFAADELIDLLYPVMKSLKTMHESGVIHRDISPDNIMLTTGGTLKLMDFGSARYYTNDERQMSVVLKQGFAPVEQYQRNSTQGPFTDVYALCATIYTCITGKMPPDSLDRLGNDRLIPPSQLGAAISPIQENALLHGMAVQAADRCPDMDALMRELRGEIQPPVMTVYADGFNVIAGQRFDRSPNYVNQQQTYQNQWGYTGQTGYPNGQNYPNQYTNGQQTPPPFEPQDNYSQQYKRQTNESKQQPKKKSNAPVIAAVFLVIIVVLAVAGFLIYLFSGSGGKKDDSTIPTATPPTTVTVPTSEATEPSSEEPTTTTPPSSYTPPPSTEVPTPAPTPGTMTQDEINAYIADNIQSWWEESDSRMSESKNGGAYEYVKCSSNRLWIGDVGSFHDDEEDKVWYFYDSSHRPYFIYQHTPGGEYRYYIKDDRVIKLTIGVSPDQEHYFQGESRIDESVEQIVAYAYSALYQTDIE